MITNEQSLQIPAAAVGAIHGFKRNEGSLFWTAAWTWFGYTLPVIAIGVAVIQGFGKPKGTP